MKVKIMVEAYNLCDFNNEIFVEATYRIVRKRVNFKIILTNNNITMIDSCPYDMAPYLDDIIKECMGFGCINVITEKKVKVKR